MRAELRRHKIVLKGFADFCHNTMQGEKNLNQQKAIKEYLLGALSDKAERRAIEEKMLLDDGFAEQLLIIEDELIDDYLDGNLDASESERFTEFFLKPPERKRKLRLARNLKKYAMKPETQKLKQFSPEKTRRFDWRALFNSPSVRLAATAVLLLIVGVVVWRVAFYESDVDKGLAQLRAAYRGQRPTESRTTANIEYAPLTVTRGDKQAAADEKARARAERYLLDATENSTDAKAFHALGLFYLAEKQFDKALDEFKLALKFAPTDAKINSDIGAVYLEKAKLAKENDKGDEVLENLALALKFTNRALELDGSSLETLFNKALILQKTPMLTNQAREAWEEYLRRDSASPWADEARKNLEELKKENRAPKDKSQILQDFLDAFRNKDDARAWEIASQTKELITGVMVQQQLAQKFLEASEQSRKEEADEILSAFVYLGELEKQNAGDRYFAELARFYKNSTGLQREKLKGAHAELLDAYQQILKPDLRQALETLDRAGQLFSSAADNWETQIIYYQTSYCYAQLGDLTKSNEILFSMAENAEKKDYKWLKGLTYGWIGSNYSSLGEHSKSISYNRKSFETARQASDTYNIQRALNQLTNEYQRIGNLNQALDSSQKSMTLSGSYYLPQRQKFRNLNFATQILVGMKFYDAAISYATENLSLVQNEIKDDWLSHSVIIQLGTIKGELGKYEEANDEFESSLRIAQNFSDPEKVRQLSARSLLSLGNAQRLGNNCGEATNNYDRAIELYGTSRFPVNQYEAEKGKLLCSAIRKDDLAVKEQMPRLIESLDNYRQRLKEDERNSFFSLEQSVYDTAIDYEYTNLKDSEQAFNYAENSRARSLLNLMRENSESAQPLDWIEIRKRIPPDVQMVYYAVLNDKILIWYISQSAFSAFEKPIKQSELENKISNYTQALVDRVDDENLRSQAKELYGLLIEPVEALLEKDKTLCFVADKSLFQVPFGSLVIPASNKYVIENYAVLLAPSATVFIEKTEAANQRAQSKSETILSIGISNVSQKEYEELAKLPAAAREAKEIAAFYDSPQVLVDNEAAKEQILGALENADVIHFAGHYIPNVKSPSLSKLLLSADDLTVEEILQKKLNRTRLMILSACETGVEKFYNGEGMIGAARAFLASGVPVVVSSQWSVDSDTAAELMVKFHRYRKLQGFTTIAALRQAQIDMLEGNDQSYRQPYFWAGFLPIGGYTNY
jgi:CHAT domain-containing protein